ncbi:MAG: enoyl-CoA hydratase-related protein [Pseudomonadota bacterium]
MDGLKIARDARGVVRLTLARPELRNAFDDGLIARLTETFAELAGDDAVRCVVLTGEGKAFSAGADMTWMRRMASYTEEENAADSRRLAEMMHALDALPHPTLALVNGPAMGGGVGLVACCDIAIAAEEAFFALSEVRLGLIPAVISPFVVNAIGVRAARRCFLTGERFDAELAADFGLVHEVVPLEDLDEAAETVIGALLASGPNAVRHSKQLIRDVADETDRAMLIAETARRIAALRVSPEGQEGLGAFLEKRAPAWAPAKD